MRRVAQERQNLPFRRVQISAEPLHYLLDVSFAKLLKKVSAFVPPFGPGWRRALLTSRRLCKGFSFLRFNFLGAKKAGENEFSWKHDGAFSRGGNVIFIVGGGLPQIYPLPLRRGWKFAVIFKL